MSSLAAANPTASGTAPARPTGAEAETIADRNDRIREIAYFLWLEEGCPDGAAERHWLPPKLCSTPNPLNASASKASLPANRRAMLGPFLAFGARGRVSGSFGGPRSAQKEISPMIFLLPSTLRRRTPKRVTVGPA
jgi:Protein of unknown function (DUF2934)